MSKADDQRTIEQWFADWRKEVRADGRVVVVVNFFTGLWWVLGPEDLTKSDIYDPAKTILEFQPVYPMRIYGAVFVALAVVQAIALLNRAPSVYGWALVAASGYWVWWAVQSAVAVGLGLISFISLGLLCQGARRHWKLAKASRWIARE